MGSNKPRGRGVIIMHPKGKDALVPSNLGKRVTRRQLLKAGVGVAGSFALSGLMTKDRPVFAAAPPTMASQISMDDLIAAAKKEGHLNTIALPPDWANYGEIMDGFTKKYGISIDNASPNASSAEELAAIRSLKGQSRAPDVVDVGPSFALIGTDEGLFTPYKCSHWSTIPATMKHVNGYWYGDYFGIIAFGINKNVVKTVPEKWADLKNPEYKGKVALNGDPRRAGAAFGAVFSAALANGGSFDDITPGIDFFADLKKMGNFIPVNKTPATVESGETPITADWDYLQIGYSKEFAGKIDWQVVILHDGIYGSYYCQAISATAPHPYASRLWMEYLYSDEGQILWLKGFSHPARFADLVKRNVIPGDLMAKLPPAASYTNVQFPNQDQLKKAQQTVSDQWGPKVAGG
jgi:putative spermidine/putrescine transport system substrate-binding protein